MDKYLDQEKIMGQRNSYSKTDTDATFMRMKEDHMKNGQLKPGYNLQISTSDQYILNYDLYSNPTDTLTLPSHVEEFITMYNQAPEELTADAGYGSEENYEFLEKNDIEAYVKYNYFHKEQKLKGRPDPKKTFSPPHLYYNQEQDYYTCPMGQKMTFRYHQTHKTTSGYAQKLSVYQAQNCKDCPLRSQCHKSKENRIIKMNYNLNRHRKKARENLTSEKGLAHRSQRPVDVEAVFGNIKQNKKFRRFHLRGKKKVLVETGLIALAHNIIKMAINRAS